MRNVCIWATIPPPAARYVKRATRCGHDSSIDRMPNGTTKTKCSRRTSTKAGGNGAGCDGGRLLLPSSSAPSCCAFAVVVVLLLLLAPGGVGRGGGRRRGSFPIGGLWVFPALKSRLRGVPAVLRRGSGLAPSITMPSSSPPCSSISPSLLPPAHQPN